MNILEGLVTLQAPAFLEKRLHVRYFLFQRGFCSLGFSLFQLLVCKLQKFNLSVNQPLLQLCHAFMGPFDFSGAAKNLNK